MARSLNLKVEHEDKNLSTRKLISLFGFRRGLLISLGLIHKAELTDDDYSRLLKADEEQFWGVVKRDFRKRNAKLPSGKLTEFEKSCAYLRWAMGVSGHGWSISKMRNAISSKAQNAKDMCVYDVIEKYDYYFDIVVI